MIISTQRKVGRMVPSQSPAALPKLLVSNPVVRLLEFPTVIILFFDGM